ncbi:hypothetical protein J6590_020819 [Homalodisca vitripennis]|nr:hypothetical protein J6590_020819 [Homalodisca vitripennis]
MAEAYKILLRQHQKCFTVFNTYLGLDSHPVKIAQTGTSPSKFDRLRVRNLGICLVLGTIRVRNFHRPRAVRVREIIKIGICKRIRTIRSTKLLEVKSFQ